ncbi:MAG: hypothetical protein NTZ71_00460 [Planctomycetota bacterium]|nr:hypothetical protein [Planctomycetota bacterium]
MQNSKNPSALAAKPLFNGLDIPLSAAVQPADGLRRGSVDLRYQLILAIASQVHRFPLKRHVPVLLAGINNRSLKKTEMHAVVDSCYEPFPKWFPLSLHSLPCKVLCFGIWIYIPKQRTRSPYYIAVIVNDDLIAEVVLLNSIKRLSNYSDILLELELFIPEVASNFNAFQWFSISFKKRDLQSLRQTIPSVELAILTKKVSRPLVHASDLHHAIEVSLENSSMQNLLHECIIKSSLGSNDAPEWAQISEGYAGGFLAGSRLWFIGPIHNPDSYLVFTCSRSCCRILTIGTLPHRRCRGNASKLFKAASTVMYLLGWRFWEVQVDSRNIPALKLFESLGFYHRCSRFAHLFPTPQS